MFEAPYDRRILAVETEWHKIQLRQYRGDCHPNSIIGSLVSWMRRGIDVMMLGDHATADIIMAKMFYKFAEHYELCRDDSPQTKTEDNARTAASDQSPAS